MMSVMLTLPEIARALGGKVSGRQVVAPGPGHSHRNRSMSITLSFASPDGFIVFPHSSRNDWRECRDHVRERLGIERHAGGRDPGLVAERRREAEVADAGERARRIVRARRLWGASIDPRGTAVETYLRSRKLDLPPDVAGRALRFHGRCPWGGEDGSLSRVPAMIAPMRDLVTGEIVAVHRTALTPDGKKVDRRMMGPSAGSAVKLDGDVSGILTVGEGIETCLAARQMGLSPVWAMGTAGAIERLPIMPGIEVLQLLEERCPTSRKAVGACTKRWADRGREVSSILPRVGKDMADVIEAGL